MAYLSHYLHYGIGFHLQNKEINSVFTNQSKPAHSTHVHTPGSHTFNQNQQAKRDGGRDINRF